MNYEYEGKSVNGRTLLREITAAGLPAAECVDSDGAETTVRFTNALSPADEAKMQTVFDAHDALLVCKASLCTAIDARTGALIALGFEFPPGGGQRFSLSQEAQSRIMGADSLRLDPLFAYPLSWNTIDDMGVMSLPDAATVHAFCLTAVGTYRAHIDAGTALKDQIRAATTSAEATAVTDDR